MNSSGYANNEAYCLFCKSRVTFTEKHRYFSFIYGKCPKGHNVARLIPKTANIQNPTKKENEH